MPKEAVIPPKAPVTSQLPSSFHRELTELGASVRKTIPKNGGRLLVSLECRGGPSRTILVDPSKPPSGRALSKLIF